MSKAARSAALARLPPPRPRPQGGRPTVFTEEVRHVILTAIRLGSYRQVAAAMAGIDDSTLSKWMKREDEPYKTFAAEILQAEAETEVKGVALLLANGDPRSLLAWLERRHAARWGRPEKGAGEAKEATEEKPAATRYDPKTLTDEQLERVIRGEPPGPGDPRRSRSGA